MNGSNRLQSSIEKCFRDNYGHTYGSKSLSKEVNEVNMREVGRKIQVTRRCENGNSKLCKPIRSGYIR